MIEIKVPAVGESINEVTLLKWNRQDGEYVERDEVIAELESEKATFEVNAEQAGTLKTAAKEGDTLKVGDLLASIDESAAKPAKQEEAPASNGQEKAPVTETAEADTKESGKKESAKKRPRRKLQKSLHPGSRLM